MYGVAPIVVIVVVFLLAFYLLQRYGDLRRQHWMVLSGTLLSWYLCFLIIFILPLDVSTTIYNQCVLDHPVQPTPVTRAYNKSTDRIQNPCEEPWSYIPDGILPVFWRVVYWTSQFLTWLLLPFMQSYARSGAFSRIGKLKEALIENAIYYGTYLLIFISLLVYSAAHPKWQRSWSDLQTIGITAANTWGLFLLVLLLGYGLVEIPRSYWLSSSHSYLLAKIYFKVAKMAEEKSEAEENLADIMEDVAGVHRCINNSHSLRSCVNTILSKCPTAYQEEMERDMERSGQEQNVNLTERSLIVLHKKVISAVQRHRRTCVQWSILLDEAFHLEDVAKSQNCSRRYFTHSFPSERRLGWIQRLVCTPTAEWYWECVVRQSFYRTLAVVLCVLSAAVVWSECTFFSRSTVLSLFAVFVRMAEKQQNYVCIEMVCFGSILFLCICVYSTVFRIRVFNYYYLVPNHLTDAYSLQFSGMLLCRLTPPLCLNFLGLIHMDSANLQQDRIQTSYISIMGSMRVLDIISDGFYIYYPMLVLLLCLGTFYRLGSKCLNLLGCPQYISDDDLTSDLVDEGRELIRRERRSRTKAEDRDSRRWAWRDHNTTGRSRSGYTEIKDDQDSLVADRKKSVLPFTRSDGEMDEQQSPLLEDYPSGENSPDNRRSKDQHYLSLSSSRMSIFDNV